MSNFRVELNMASRKNVVGDSLNGFWLDADESETCRLIDYCWHSAPGLLFVKLKKWNF
jgi:hypothetical protein